MAGRIPTQFIDELLARVDIVEVIDERISLRKAGREFSACCPFHDEKTPSFTVSPDKQFYHCFGCGMHGSAISFMMEYERLEFVDAVEELAQRAGLPVPRESSGTHFEPVGKDSFDVLEKAARFYQQQLKQAADADRAVEYLRQRGLTGKTAADFGIGFAPAGWDNLIQALSSQGVNQQQLLEAGLVIKRDNGGFYDRFRDRIMFPIRDRRGRTIAFGGRVLGDDTPKYLNSPETPLFHKGQELYGLYEARQANRKLSQLVVVEGYMDVVSLSQHDVSIGVATLGTATTPEHLERIFRVVASVVFCFDGDRAGREAAHRAMENAAPVIKEGRQIDFMFLPQGEDPDTIVRNEGRQGFEERMAQAIPFSQFFFDGLSEGLDLEIPEGRAMLIQKAKPLMAKLTPGVFQVMMQDKLAELSRMPATKMGLSVPSSNDRAGQSERPRQRLVKPAAGTTGLSPVRLAIRLVMENPQLAAQVELSRLSGLAVPGMELLDNIVRLAQQNSAISCGAMLEHWRDTENGRHLSRLMRLPLTIPEGGAEAEFLGAIARLAEQRARQRADELMDKQARGGLSPEEREELNRGLAGK